MGVNDMEDTGKLVISLSEAARKKFSELDNEGYISIQRVGRGWSAYYAALVEGGKPQNIEDYIQVADGDLVLWVPMGMQFQDDKIDVDVLRSIWGSRLLVKSVALPASSCSADI